MSRRGAALAETALLLPVLLGLALGVAQLALLAQARLLAQAAAVSAARAAIADPAGTRLSPARAASATLAPLVPARNPLLKAAVSAAKTSVRVDLGRDEAEAEVEHHLELLVPVAGLLFVRMEESWGLLPGSPRRALEAHALRNRALSGLYREPHVRILARARLPAPWLEARRQKKR